MFWIVVFSPAILLLCVSGLSALGMLSLSGDARLGLHYITMGAQVFFLFGGFLYEAIFRRKQRDRWPRYRKVLYYVLVVLLLFPLVYSFIIDRFS